jgi:hypothetical protein
MLGKLLNSNTWIFFRNMSKDFQNITSTSLYVYNSSSEVWEKLNYTENMHQQHTTLTDTQWQRNALRAAVTKQASKYTNTDTYW